MHVTCKQDYSDLLGKPFSELPCYQLVQTVYRRNGIELPDYTAFDVNDETKHGNFKEVKGDPKPGCLCVYHLEHKDADHVAVYLGDNKIIHSTKAAGVVVERYSRYLPKLIGVYQWYD